MECIKQSFDYCSKSVASAYDGAKFYAKKGYHTVCDGITSLPQRTYSFFSSVFTFPSTTDIKSFTSRTISQIQNFELPKFDFITAYFLSDLEKLKKDFTTYDEDGTNFLIFQIKKGDLKNVKLIFENYDHFSIDLKQTDLFICRAYAYNQNDIATFLCAGDTASMKSGRRHICSFEALTYRASFAGRAGDKGLFEAAYSAPFAKGDKKMLVDAARCSAERHEQTEFLEFLEEKYPT